MTAYWINKESMTAFRMKKTKVGPGPHEIELIDIAFHLLTKQLEDIGARQVILESFPAGDANETASSALLHVWMTRMRDKTGLESASGYGICSTQPIEKTTAKHNAEK
jgi:hypothetical protein